MEGHLHVRLKSALRDVTEVHQEPVAQGLEVLGR